MRTLIAALMAVVFLFGAMAPPAAARAGSQTTEEEAHGPAGAN